MPSVTMPQIEAALALMREYPQSVDGQWAFSPGPSATPLTITVTASPYTYARIDRDGIVRYYKLTGRRNGYEDTLREIEIEKPERPT